MTTFRCSACNLMKNENNRIMIPFGNIIGDKRVKTPVRVCSTCNNFYG